MPSWLNALSGYSVMTAYITVFMKTTDHRGIESCFRKADIVREACRISGDGCCLIRVVCDKKEKLNQFLDQIMRYGTYRLNLTTEIIKSGGRDREM